MPTRGQLALIHVARRELGLDDQRYRDILVVETGRDSSRDLDEGAIERVLRRFEEMGFVAKRTSVPPSRPARGPRGRRLPQELPTPGQMAKIQHLWEDVGWMEAERRRGFTRRQCDGQPWPQTRDQAGRLIEALKAMIARDYSNRTPRTPRARTKQGGGHGG